MKKRRGDGAPIAMYEAPVGANYSRLHGRRACKMG